MTIKVTITHDEPTNEHSITVGVLKDLPGYDVPQFEKTQEVKPGGSISLHVYLGQEIKIWETPLPVELLVADEIERAMHHVKTIPAPKLDPRSRIQVAKAAIAAARRRA